METNDIIEEKEYNDIENKIREFNKKYKKSINIYNCNEEINRRLDNLNADMNDNVNYYVECINKKGEEFKNKEEKTFKDLFKYLDLKFNESNNLKKYKTSILKSNSLLVEVAGSNYFINYFDKNRLYYYIKESGTSNLVPNLEELYFKKVLSYSNYLLGIDNENNKLFSFDINTNEKNYILNNCLDFLIDGDKLYAINDHKVTILKVYNYEILSIYQLIGETFLKQNEEFKNNLERYLSLEKNNNCLYINYGGINYIIDLDKNCITYKSI
ncbi:hypothetical protein [Clostridium tarantellae]|uniref:Uncharacterized protein n=1 Tax=Clostridium tarantellae TaxID=39493 RepID=A0A6I1MJZ6_9CLOT|nr:hypothetical protein [Clostridium tarantellae]MPQ43274.1 hypothetical protein [Clostridium tarantellae]